MSSIISRYGQLPRIHSRSPARDQILFQESYVVELTREERESMSEERERYRNIMEKARKAKPCPVRKGVEITCIGNTGGADNQVHGRPCGGFLLRTGCRTIIVDPGNNSMAELGCLGMELYDITDVLASHAHSDHVGDLTTAVSAAVNLGLVDNCHSNIILTPSLVDYNSEQSTRFGYTLPAFAWKAEVVSLYPDEVEVKTLDNRSFRSKRSTSIAEDIQVFATEARHGQIAVTGFVIETPHGRIGYTSDTEYFDRLPGQFANCDLLWMNMNTLGLEAIDDTDAVVSDPSIPVNNHLGYVGVCKLIEEVQPTTAVVSHFGAQLIDQRGEVEAMLRKRFVDDPIAIFCPDNGDSFFFAQTLSDSPAQGRFVP